MDEKEIIEGNKLIAEFDGWDLRHDNVSYRKQLTETTSMTCHESNLKYNSDYNWLMAVVEKIEKMDYGFKMCRKVVEVYIDSTKETFIKRKESCRLDSLYVAIVDFIELYNKK